MADVNKYLFAAAVIALIFLAAMVGILWRIDSRIRHMDTAICQGECKLDSSVAELDRWMVMMEYWDRTRTGYVPEEVKRHVDSVYKEEW